MRILAADTSTAVITVAVTDATRLIAETYVECDRGHSERLLSTVEWTLNEAGCKLADIDAFAISAGPGSFTGLRVGVAVFKGLALAQSRPLVGVPTLDAMANTAALHDGIVCPLIDARMKEVFGAVYSFAAGERQTLHGARTAPIEDIVEHTPAGTLFLGDGARLYQSQISHCVDAAVFAPAHHACPRAATVAAEAAALLRSGAPSDPGAVEPVYLRKAQAEQIRAEANNR